MSIAGKQRSAAVQVSQTAEPERSDHLSGHEHDIWDAAIAVEPGVLVTAGEDHCVRVWRTATPEEVAAENWTDDELLN